MAADAVRVVCAGCGAVAGPDIALPFRCGQADLGGDADHLLVRQLPAAGPAPLACDPTESQPFLRYRQRLYSYAVARHNGISDAEFVALVRQLDAQVAAVDGAGFGPTSLARLPAIEALLGSSDTGRVLGKRDAASVAGSHKARHLFGIMLTLLVRERLGGTSDRVPLAIASCGNAALAAAVVARAAAWPLRVFVPPDAEPAVLQRLASLGAAIQLCPRVAGEAGDPCVLRFREAVAQGALPFCCQGNENGLTIEGGETLAYELVEQGTAMGGLDRLLVQVGGGALMSALVQGLEHAVQTGALARMPVLHAVQTQGGYPLARAWQIAAAAIEAGVEATGCGERPLGATAPANARSAWLRQHFDHPAAQVVRDRMRSHRSEFMWPWETPPHSVAHGILDDETYDWRVLVEAMLATGGHPIVVDDATILQAREIANRGADLPISATGAAGLGGLLALGRAGGLAPGERVAVILSGRER